MAVIMILPFDPFGLRRIVYTVKNRCMEEPEMEYEDGAATLFLYIKGTKGAHRMVEMLKIDSETTIYCVGLMEKLAAAEQNRETE